MTYLKRTNVNAKRSRVTSFFVGVLILCVFLIHYFFPNFYAGLLYPVTSIFWKSESGTLGFFGDFGQLVFSKYSLVQDNERLTQEVASRDTSMLLINSLKDENEQLKSALGRTAKGNDVLGVVLSRPPVALYDTLVIDVGRTDGVAIGDKVYADGDTLIGDIAELYDNQSKVSLFSTPGRITSVIVNKKNISAQATGRGLGNFMIHVPVASGVQQGDSIDLPQIRPHTFGVVETVLVDSSGSLQTILFKSPVNINSIRFVEVDRNSK